LTQRTAVMLPSSRPPSPVTVGPGSTLIAPVHHQLGALVDELRH
jgi:hypothetical protein